MGLGVALRVLFDNDVSIQNSNNIKLKRSEIVALINLFGRLVESIVASEKFQNAFQLQQREVGSRVGSMCFAGVIILAALYFTKYILFSYTILNT